MAYKKAPFFNDAFELFQAILKHKELNLSAWVNQSFTLVMNYLGIEKNIITSSSIYNNRQLKAQDKIIDICKQEKAAIYINPPGGRTLYQSKEFASAGIELQFIKPQLDVYQQYGSNEFISGLSILDLLMNMNKESALVYLNNYSLEQ